MIDNALESAARYFRVVWYGNGEGPAWKLTPHNDVAATLSYLNKSMLLKDPANLAPREDSKLGMYQFQFRDLYSTIQAALDFRFVGFF